MIWNIIIGIVIISVIAIIHELGHYITAKLSGVTIEEAGLGLPPRIIGKKWRGTIYSLNWIPFGAFVRMAGEVDPEVPGSLASKKPPTKLMVLAAGSVMMFILAFLILPVAYMVPHDVVQEPVLVKEVAAGSPAEIAGLRTGDTLLKINEESLDNNAEMVRNIQLHLGDEIQILTRHSDGTEETVALVPRWNPPEGEGAIGIVLDLEASAGLRKIVKESDPFWVAIPKGTVELFDIVVLYKDGLFAMISGSSDVQLVGPVGVVQIAGEVARAGLSPLLEFAAIISLILGIVNLFPLPALDGGRIVFVIIEWIRGGKRVSPRVENIVHTVGFLALITVMVLITYQDIARIIAGESLFG